MVSLILFFLTDYFIGLSDQEEALHSALTAMQSFVNKKMGIEERLENCEKVLRLLLRIQVEAMKSSQEEQKEQVIK